MESSRIQEYATELRVSFGDCDPAGIVYYPNYFIWIDRVFHQLLRRDVGGHAMICRALGAQGIGLMQVEMAFRSPAVEGDLLELRISGITWSRKNFAISYEAQVANRLVFTAVETRGVFVSRSKGIGAADVTDLQNRMTSPRGRAGQERPAQIESNPQ